VIAAHVAHAQEWAQRFERKRGYEQRLDERACVVVRGTTSSLFIVALSIVAKLINAADLVPKKLSALARLE